MNTTTPSSFPDADALERLLAERYSCRGFLPQPVPQATIERILALAQRTASWCNAQPWQLAITRGAGTERFRQTMFAHAREPAAPDFPWPREYQGAYLQRRRECGYALYESVGVARGDREGSARQTLENFRFFGAPHVAVVSTAEALGVYGAIDCGAYVANFMLAARSLGVACIAQAALASHSGLIRSHFGLGDDRRVVCGISFGYEDTGHPANRFRTTRAPLEEAVRWVDD
ncbi:nitroreductase [Variovorax sp. WS11]|uniref:nitroreductase n=1 Tax=Variovorax sp. WS11 TaxID=1105204 RepID=UPI000D0E1754|nr:nitroreductase [Variovorax sp. WS11]NDZ18546.1 nitroreductase [Variovorax sp. WS11]PSL85178.1 nitroreductase [Variovorax sp. WS11]